MGTIVGSWAQDEVRKTTIAQSHSAAELLQREYDRTIQILNEVASMEGMTFPSEQEWNGHRLACQMIRERLEIGRG